MFIKELRKRAIRKIRLKGETWFGKLIIKNSSHASPDFIVIGAAKSGTTSLFQYLAQHPRIITASKKEIKYFGMGRHRNGLKWYLSHYALKKQLGNKLTFEATPTYIYNKERAAQQIAHLFPRIKLILSLRNPVDRAYSHWNSYQKHTKLKNIGNLRDDRSFNQAVQEEIKNPESVPRRHRYLEKGLYAQQLRAWYKYFDPNQILIIDFKDLKNDPQAILGETCEHLNIHDVYQEYKPSQKKEWSIKNIMDENKEKQIKAYNANVYLGNAMDQKTEHILKDYFSKPNAALKELTGRKFSWME